MSLKTKILNLVRFSPILIVFALASCLNQSKLTRNNLKNIDSGMLPSAKTIQAWHERKAIGIHSFTGSPSWKDYVSVVESGLEDAGVIDVIRDRFTYDRWYTSDDPKDNKWTLHIEGESIPVASYWAYSGSTDDEGLTAPLIIWDRKLTPEDMQGKIVVFEIEGLSPPLPSIFQEAGYEFATDIDTFDPDSVLSSNQWFQTNYVTRFGRLDSKLKKSGAAGAIVIFDLSFERTAGLYTFPLLEPGIVGAPGLYVDRDTGLKVKRAAEKNAEATLRLLTTEEEVEGHFFTGFLPGRNYGTDEDEYVFLITHSDGPNLTQDNGGFAILSIIQYLGQIKQENRPRTIAIMMDPQHFTPHRHRDNWYEMHPEIVEKVIASIGVEHLGQLEYIEKDGSFQPSGLPETTLIFAQDNDNLVNAAIEAVNQFNLPRTMVQSPPRGGQGNWSGMSDVSVKRNYPGYGISTNMSAYWSTKAGIKTFDKDLFRKQVGVATQLTAALMVLSQKDMEIPPDDKKRTKFR
ncbi:MAG: hypothetical protein VYA80_01570 [Pseudomonadota bacterium]|nr:hypothetical protein [Pseudomonadota bacterium]